MTLTPNIDFVEQSRVQGRHIKELAIVAIFLAAGCAATSGRPGDSDPAIAQLEQKRRALNESEKKCVDEATTRSNDEMAATPGVSVESPTQNATGQRDREISQCHAWADHENAEIAEQERIEYEQQAQQQRNRASFIAVLTTSRMH
jgi:hypothetical protein